MASIISPNIKILLSDDKRGIAPVCRKTWDEVLKHFKEEITILHMVRFEPDNDCIILQYDRVYSRLEDVYVPRPHLKLLEKISEYDELRAGVRHYILHSANVKEQFATMVDDDNEYWNSIRQESKDWMMSIILGGRD